MSRLVYRLKTSAVLWQCGWSGTNTPPDEGGQNYLHVPTQKTVGKEKTSLVSTPSLAELYRFAMNFMLVRKKKRKKNRDGRKRGK